MEVGWVAGGVPQRLKALGSGWAEKPSLKAWRTSIGKNPGRLDIPRCGMEPQPACASELRICGG